MTGKRIQDWLKTKEESMFVIIDEIPEVADFVLCGNCRLEVISLQLYCPRCHVRTDFTTEALETLGILVDGVVN